MFNMDNAANMDFHQNQNQVVPKRKRSSVTGHEIASVSIQH